MEQRSSAMSDAGGIGLAVSLAEQITLCASDWKIRLPSPGAVVAQAAGMWCTHPSLALQGAMQTHSVCFAGAAGPTGRSGARPDAGGARGRAGWRWAAGPGAGRCAGRPGRGTCSARSAAMVGIAALGCSPARQATHGR